MFKLVEKGPKAQKAEPVKGNFESQNKYSSLDDGADEDENEEESNGEEDEKGDAEAFETKEQKLHMIYGCGCGYTH